MTMNTAHNIMNAIVIAQSNTSEQMEAMLQSEQITAGALITTIIAGVILAFRVLFPVIIDRIRSHQVSVVEKEKNKLEQAKKEAELELEQKTFLAQQARESIETVHNTLSEYKKEIDKLREANNAYTIELAELRASNTLMRKQMDTLTKRYSEAEANNIWTKDALESSQIEQARLEAKVEALEQSVRQLEHIEKLYQEEKVTNATLIEKVTTLKTQIALTENQLATVIKERDEAERLVEGLRSKIWEYRMKVNKQTGKESKPDNTRPKRDTDELLGVINDNDR